MFILFLREVIHPYDRVILVPFKKVSFSVSTIYDFFFRVHVLTFLCHFSCRSLPISKRYTCKKCIKPLGGGGLKSLGERSVKNAIFRRNTHEMITLRGGSSYYPPPTDNLDKKKFQTYPPPASLDKLQYP